MGRIKIPRKVKDEIDTIEPEDHNIKVDNFEIQTLLNDKIYEKRYKDDPELEKLLSELKVIVGRMVRVKRGEFVYAIHHNIMVDAFTIQKQINQLLEDQITYWREEAEKWKHLYEIKPPMIYVEEEIVLGWEITGIMYLEEDVSVLGHEATITKEVGSESVAIGEEVSVVKQA